MSTSSQTMSPRSHRAMIHSGLLAASSSDGPRLRPHWLQAFGGKLCVWRLQRSISVESTARIKGPLEGSDVPYLLRSSRHCTQLNRHLGFRNAPCFLLWSYALHCVVVPQTRRSRNSIVENMCVDNMPFSCHVVLYVSCCDPILLASPDT